jgi:hypothetical protein
VVLTVPQEICSQFYLALAPGLYFEERPIESGKFRYDLGRAVSPLMTVSRGQGNDPCRRRDGIQVPVGISKESISCGVPSEKVFTELGSEMAT